MQRCFGNLPEFHGWGVVETGFKPWRSGFSIFTLGQHTDPSAPSSILFAPPCNHPGPGDLGQSRIQGVISQLCHFCHLHGHGGITL